MILYSLVLECTTEAKMTLTRSRRLSVSLSRESTDYLCQRDFFLFLSLSLAHYSSLGGVICRVSTLARLGAEMRYFEMCLKIEYCRASAVYREV